MGYQNKNLENLIEERYIIRSNLDLLRQDHKNFRELTLRNILACYEGLKKAKEAIKSANSHELWHYAEIVSEKSILAGAYRISPLIKELILASKVDQKEKILDKIQGELMKFMLCLDKIIMKTE